MLAPDARAQHLLTGTLVSSDLGLSVQGEKRRSGAARAGAHRDQAAGRGVVDVLVDPTARLELSLARDGLAVAPRELLLGPFSLPLLSGRTEAKPATAASSTSNPEATASSAAIVLDGALLDRLSSSYAPVPGERGGSCCGATRPLRSRRRQHQLKCRRGPDFRWRICVPLEECSRGRDADARLGLRPTRDDGPAASPAPTAKAAPR